MKKSAPTRIPMLVSALIIVLTVRLRPYLLYLPAGNNSHPLQRPRRGGRLRRAGDDLPLPAIGLLFWVILSAVSSSRGLMGHLNFPFVVPDEAKDRVVDLSRAMIAWMTTAVTGDALHPQPFPHPQLRRGHERLHRRLSRRHGRCRRLLPHQDPPRLPGRAAMGHCDMNKYKTILFDFDGTLLYTVGGPRERRKLRHRTPRLRGALRRSHPAHGRQRRQHARSPRAAAGLRHARLRGDHGRLPRPL